MDHPAERAHFRRPPEAVRRLTLSAARELFAEKGYHGATTREIAERAGVGEPVLFRNFGSKAGLFEASVLQPFTAFLEQWARTWERTPPETNDPEAVTRSFAKGFYGVVERHRDLLLTLVAAHAPGADPVLAEIARKVGEDLGDSLRVMQRLLHAYSAALDYEDLDPPVTVAITAGSVLSLVLLSGWVFPPHERRPGRARQIDELTKLLMHGIAHRRTEGGTTAAQ